MAANYTIEVPFPPGAELWFCGNKHLEDVVPCPECEGSLHVVVETHTGRYQVMCEACERGWMGSTGKLATSSWACAPERVVIGKPHVEGDERVWYHTVEEDSLGGGGTMHYSDRLFYDRAECQATCDRLNTEQIEYVAKGNEQRCGRGRTEAARAMSYRKKEIERLERDLAYARERLKLIVARAPQPKGGQHGAL